MKALAQWTWCVECQKRMPVEEYAYGHDCEAS